MDFSEAFQKKRREVLELKVIYDGGEIASLKYDKLVTKSRSSNAFLHNTMEKLTFEQDTGCLHHRQIHHLDRKKVALKCNQGSHYNQPPLAKTTL